MPRSLQFIRRSPHTGPEPGEKSGSGGRRLDDLRAHHRDSENVGLKLHEHIVGGSTPIGTELLDLLAGISIHRIDDVAGLVGDAVEGGADDVLASAAPGETDDRSPSPHVPVGSAEPGEGRNDEDPAGVLDLGGDVFGLGRAGDQAHLVPQPLDRRTGVEDRPFEGVGWPPLGVAADGR